MEKENKTDKAVTIRIPITLYDFFVEKALNIAQDERKIVKVSTLMRESMEAGKEYRMVETVKNKKYGK